MASTLGQAQTNHINTEEPMAAKKASKKSAKTITAAKIPMTKSAMLDQIVQNTGLPRGHVSAAIDELATLIESQLNKGGAVQFTLPGLTEIEVKRKAAAEPHPAELGQERSRKTLTLDEAFERYQMASNVENSAYYLYKVKGSYNVWLKPRLGATGLDQITVEDLLKLKAEMFAADISRGYARWVISIVKLIYNAMAKWNLFRGFNPATAVDWKGADANMRRALTLDEVIRLLEELKRTHIDTYRKACFAVYAGLRKGEIHRLTVGDINLEINQLRVRDVKDPNAKGRVRELFFPPQLRAVIEEIYAERQLGDNDLLFETSFQDRVWLRVVNRLRFNDNREPMDRLTFHGLRHTYAALLGASSGSPLAVQKQLGHSDIQKSMMYTRLDPEVAVSAVQLLGEKFAQREAELKVNKLPRRKKRGIKDLS